MWCKRDPVDLVTVDYDVTLCWRIFCQLIVCLFIYPGWSVGDTCLVHDKLMDHSKLIQIVISLDSTLGLYIGPMHNGYFS